VKVKKKRLRSYYLIVNQGFNNVQQKIKCIKIHFIKVVSMNMEMSIEQFIAILGTLEVHRDSGTSFDIFPKQRG